MRFFSALSSALLVGAAAAQSCSPSSSDAQVVEFGWALQYLLERYYSSQPLNSTFLNSADNSSTANYYTNFQGIQRQNRLGVRAVQQLGSKVPGFSAPRCNFTFPNAKDGETWVKNAQKLEQNVCGAYIGLAAYTQAPEVSFLMARLAAQHSAHAYYITSNVQEPVFPTNSSSLIPAYPPDYVLQSGNQPGKLGDYLNGCVSAPSPPCGQKLTFGPLIASTGGANASSSSASPSGTATAFAKRLFY
ncbi:hypothetical protein ATEIFO6365_0008029600 [Aspergillus terreus]|uniref:Uncharacterized protein n=1 Tax=Aspergillus terreus TaxID=33178 RepID=A0A5M3Z7G7_ASPTE|nr:hypothetical protein ATETN484_0010030500 [Aspergillus terreus]GFF18352.1 hypothetical protein ATEIFO6365_0008029600 [Aspergillus terreus]